MNIEKLELRILGYEHITNTYLIYDENKEAVLIDPADEKDKIINKIEELGLNVKNIVLTHGHFDHTNALYDLVEYTNAKVLIHKDDVDMLLGKVDDASSIFDAIPKYINEKDIQEICDGYILNIGNMELEILHTPGHTAGSIVIYAKNKNVLITGDTIFANAFGRCDLATSNMDNMVLSLRKVFNRFDVVDITIYPGHGESSKLKTAKKYIKLLLALRKIEL